MMPAMARNRQTTMIGRRSLQRGSIFLISYTPLDSSKVRSLSTFTEMLFFISNEGIITFFICTASVVCGGIVCYVVAPFFSVCVCSLFISFVWVGGLICESLYAARIGIMSSLSLSHGSSPQTPLTHTHARGEGGKRAQRGDNDMIGSRHTIGYTVHNSAAHTPPFGPGDTDPTSR